jgi:hypothetical protein
MLEFRCRRKVEFDIVTFTGTFTANPPHTVSPASRSVGTAIHGLVRECLALPGTSLVCFPSQGRLVSFLRILPGLKGTRILCLKNLVKSVYLYFNQSVHTKSWLFYLLKISSGVVDDKLCIRQCFFKYFFDAQSIMFSEKMDENLTCFWGKLIKNIA